MKGILAADALKLVPSFEEQLAAGVGLFAPDCAIQTTALPNIPPLFSDGSDTGVVGQ